ncbi:MAG: alkaline phosphatase family protein, partial [bacterium]|nr:alkaline phosphatase family protein [bacterium]
MSAHTGNGHPSKMVMLGLDAAVPDLVKAFMSEGALPNLQRLYQSGVYARHITTFPTLTAPAWAAISCGAAIGTAGIPSLTIKEPGEPLDTCRSCFDTRFLEAETLWHAAGKVGKKTVLMNWPVTWPAVPINGVQIAGSINPPFRFYYLPIHDFAPSCVFSTEPLPCDQVQGRVIRIPASDIESGEFGVAVPATLDDKKRFRIVLRRGPDGRHDGVEIRAESPDVAERVLRLAVGETTPWIKTPFTIGGKSLRGQFRFTLTELSPDGRTVKLYASAVATDEPITIPPRYSDGVVQAAGPYWEVDDPWAYLNGW